MRVQYEPPYFITIYGGLSWEPGTGDGNKEFWSLLNGIMHNLGEDYVAVGASEMARLARAACNYTGAPPAAPPGPPSCAVAAKQHDCRKTPGRPWKNSTEKACVALNCCWHARGVKPSVSPSAPRGVTDHRATE